MAATTAAPVANPARTRLESAPVPLEVTPLDVVIQYGVFNDQVRMTELVDAGTMHALMADRMMEPLFRTEVAGEAKREQRRLNRYRMEDPVNSMLGPALLREQTVTRTPWTTITGQDYEDIDDGTRPNG